MLAITQIRPGLIEVKCIYKPPYILKLDVGGLKYTLESNSYNFKWVIENRS